MWAEKRRVCVQVGKLRPCKEATEAAPYAFIGWFVIRGLESWGRQKPGTSPAGASSGAGRPSPQAFPPCSPLQRPLQSTDVRALWAPLAGGAFPRVSAVPAREGTGGRAAHSRRSGLLATWTSPLLRAGGLESSQGSVTSAGSLRLGREAVQSGVLLAVLPRYTALSFWAFSSPWEGRSHSEDWTALHCTGGEAEASLHKKLGEARIRTRSAHTTSAPLGPAGMEVQPRHHEVPQPPCPAVFWGSQKDPRPRDVPAEEPGFPTVQPGIPAASSSATPSPERMGLAASSLGDLAFLSSCDRLSASSLGAVSLSLPVALGVMACWEGQVGIRRAEGPAGRLVPPCSPHFVFPGKSRPSQLEPW